MNASVKMLMLSLAMVLMGVRSASLYALDIVKDGKPEATVVIPVFTKEQKETDKRWTEMAAGWLTNYVKKATGAEIKIVTEGTPVNGRVVSIGHTKLAEAAGIRIIDKKPESHKSRKPGITITEEERAQLGNVCRLAVKDDILFLIGKDRYGPAEYVRENGRRVEMSYLGAKGTCHAVARFLEDYVGCRWYIPTPQGEYVPATNSISVPDNLDQTVIPPFPYVTSGLGDVWHPQSPILIANNLWPGILVMGHGGDSWSGWVPADKYGREHPEYYALINGKRQCDTNQFKGYLCTSNPEVRALLLKGIRANMDEGFDWVELGQADGFRRCQCATCEQLDNYRIDSIKGGIADPDNPCERIFLLHKYIIDECKKSHPDKKVHLLIYGPTGTPSKKIANFGDNVIGEMCGATEADFNAWKTELSAKTVYVYFWGTYGSRTGIGPKLSPKVLAEKIRLFRNNNVLGFYFCGGGEDWGLEGPVYYTVGRLLGNPDLNPDDCVKDYCRIYGNVAGTMEQFYSILYERLVEGGLTQTETIFPAIFPPDILQKLDSLLSRAELEADSERAKGWLRLTRTCFDYNRLTAEMFMLYHAYQIQKDLPSLKVLRSTVDKWQAHCQKMLIAGKDKDYIANWYPGWDMVREYLSGGTYDGGVHIRSAVANNAPVTLNFDALEKNYLQKQAGGRTRIIAPRVKTPVTLENLLDEGTWNDTKPCLFSTLLGNKSITAGTQVRLMFDDRNLYVRFECEEPEIGKMKLEKEERDGNVWCNECVEIVFDPWATRAKYLHLIAMPKEGCYYDARFGFITDLLNPMAGKEDLTWNPEWQYKFKINNEGKKWILVAMIPFASLQVEVPKAHTVWTGNFCRERYAGKQTEYSLWSVGESDEFCDPAAFGEICFEREEAKTP